MAKTVELTDEEAVFLADLLDWWDEGYKEAQELTTQDRDLEMEQVLELVGAYKHQSAMCNVLKDKIRVDSHA